MNDKPRKPRKPYPKLSEDALKARRIAAMKATAASANARRGKAPGGVLSKDLISRPLSPLTVAKAKELQLPGQSFHDLIHQAVMALDVITKLSLPDESRMDCIQRILTASSIADFLKPYKKRKPKPSA